MKSTASHPKERATAVSEPEDQEADIMAFWLRNETQQKRRN
jgi:hypothetical protein